LGDSREMAMAEDDLTNFLDGSFKEPNCNKKTSLYAMRLNQGEGKDVEHQIESSDSR